MDADSDCRTCLNGVLVRSEEGEVVRLHDAKLNTSGMKEE